VSENFTSEELEACTPEQRAEIERIEGAVDAFLADSRSIRYVGTDENADALFEFLEAHDLKVSHANLLFAYGSLCAEGALELMPFAAPIMVEEQPPAPVPAESPAPIPTSPRAPVAWRNGKAIELTNARPL